MTTPETLSSPELSARKRSPWLRRLRWLYLGVVGVGIVFLLTHHGEELRSLRRVRIAGLLLTLFLAGGQFGVQCAFWWRSLQRQGQAIGFDDSLLAGLRAVLANYIPGSLWFSVSRAGLLWRQGASPTSLLSTGVLENVLSVLVALSFGSVVYALQTGVSWLFLAPATLFLASPPVWHLVAHLVPRLEVGDRYTWPLFGELVGWLFFFWSWSATTFAVFLRSFPALAENLSYFDIVAAFLVSWSVGYLAIFAPQGVGVFEVSLAALLGFTTASGSQPFEWVTVAAGYRGVILVRDLLFALGGGIWHSRRTGSFDA